MQKFENERKVRHVETQECAHVMKSFLKDGLMWYQVMTLGSAIGEWEETKITYEPQNRT